MKKVIVLGALCLSSLLSSCNDGDIVYKEINLDSVTRIDRCGTQGTENIFFKINNSEAMILKANADDIMRDETIEIASIDIDGTNTSLEYRKYADKVTSASICQTPPPGFPNVVQQISSMPGGTVEIRRQISIDNKTTQEPTGINTVGLTYQYSFMLYNINFSEGNTNIKYDRMPFGTNNYLNRTLNFKFTQTDGTLKPAYSCNNSFIALGDKEALFLTIDPTDFPTQEGTVTIPLSDTNNLTFKQYERAGINLNQVCENQGDIPDASGTSVNKLIELWNSNQGNVVITSRWTVPAQGGQSQFEHTITLQNVTFYKNAYSNLLFAKPYIPFGIFVQE